MDLNVKRGGTIGHSRITNISQLLEILPDKPDKMAKICNKNGAKNTNTHHPFYGDMFCDEERMVISPRRTSRLQQEMNVGILM